MQVDKLRELGLGVQEGEYLILHKQEEGFKACRKCYGFGIYGTIYDTYFMCGPCSGTGKRKTFFLGTLGNY